MFATPYAPTQKPGTINGWVRWYTASKEIPSVSAVARWLINRHTAMTVKKKNNWVTSGT